MRHSVMIWRVVEIQSVLRQRPRSSQQNNLLENKSENSERPERLGLEKLSTEELID